MAKSWTRSWQTIRRKSYSPPVLQKFICSTTSDKMKRTSDKMKIWLPQRWMQPCTNLEVVLRGQQFSRYRRKRRRELHPGNLSGSPATTNALLVPAAHQRLVAHSV